MTNERYRRNACESLTDCLHETMVGAGDILGHIDVIVYIEETEAENGIHFTAREIASAVYRAADRFVDSMVQNCYDTDYTDHVSNLDADIAQWESRRPSSIRHEKLLELAKTLDGVR